MNFQFFTNTRKTFKYLAFIATLFLLLVTILLYVRNNSFYTCYSDDLLQYFKMSEDFVLKLKTGNLSFYQFNNYLGASFYSDTYYVPIDIFTFITTFLSFFLNFELAFGITELIKLFLGTMVFGYYLKLRGHSNKAVFFVSLIYLVSGYNVTMMAFSAFFSLAFYFPFGALCIELFKRKKKFIVPLGVMVICFYNFYLAYTVILFMALVFIVDYILDHKLVDYINRFELSDDACLKEKAKVYLKAFGLYIRDLLSNGVYCALLMLLGVIMALVILYPSALFILKDIFPRSGEKYLFWTFNDASQNCTAIQQYMRILGEIFTPAESTAFYAFNNSYITDHLSLYFTISGLLIFLYVFSMKDRESRIYKVLIVFEVILLIFPAFYMLFSLSFAPYTRWFGILNFLNLLIVAHVISKHGFDISLNKWSAILRSVALICLILYVINYFAIRVYDVKLFEYIATTLNIKDGVLEPVWTNGSFESLKYDLIFMLVAIGIIIFNTALSFQKKFNILPYVLVVELVISSCFMFGTKFAFYDLNTYATEKDIVNNYLDEVFPANNNFERFSLNVGASKQWGWDRSFTRTNLQLTDLKQFHSFYDQSANDFVGLVYDQSSKNNETRNSKALIDEYSLFVHQLLANRYVVVENNGYQTGVTPFHSFVENSDVGSFISYELSSYYPFMIYDTLVNKGLLDSDVTNHLQRQQILLNYLYFDASKNDNYRIDNMPVDISAGSSNEKRKYNGKKYNYSMSNSEIKYDTFNSFEGIEYLGYFVNGEELDYFTENYVNSFPEQGIMHFYYNVDNQGTRMVEIKNALIEYADGTIERAFGGYAYYNTDNNLGKPVTVWVENSGEVLALDNYASTPGSKHILSIEIDDYACYESFIERMEEYSNLNLTIDNSKLHASFERENNAKTLVAAMPIAYNGDWQVDGDYDLVNVNGGFLGVVIPPGRNNIEFTLSFKPKGLKISSYASAVGLIGYSGYIFVVERKRKKHEEDIDNCTML